MPSHCGAPVCMCLCTCRVWFSCTLLVSALSDHIDSCIHACTRILRHMHTRKVKRARQVFPGLKLSYHVRHSGKMPSLHHAVFPKKLNSFHTANGYRKRNIFILIICSTQGFICYSPTLCPFIALNDG